MKKFTKVLAVILVIAIVGCFAACGGKTENDTTKAPDEQKVLKLATSADFPPYEFIADDGSYKGIDVDIAKAVAEKLGCKLEVVNMDFDSIIGSVSTGKCDFGMAGITYTDERAKSVDFSKSYANGVQAVIVPENSKIKTVDDLYAEGADFTVGVQLSTTGDIYFSGDVDDGKTTCKVKQFTVNVDAIEALKTGKVDAVIIDNEPAKSFVKANEGLKILETEFANEDYCIALKKDNPLKADVDKALDELKADGTLDKIVGEYIPAK